MSGDTAEKRVGQDGKSYPAKVTKPKPVVEAAREPPLFPTDPDIDDDATAAADHEEGLRVIATRGFLFRASESAALAHYPRGSLVVTNEIMRSAEDAAQSWADLVSELEEAKPVVEVDDDDSEVASPAVVEGNILYGVARMNENLRSFRKILMVSALDRDAADRINTALEATMKKARAVQTVIGRAPAKKPKPVPKFVVEGYEDDDELGPEMVAAANTNWRGGQFILNCANKSIRAAQWGTALHEKGLNAEDTAIITAATDAAQSWADLLAKLTTKRPA